MEGNKDNFDKENLNERVEQIKNSVTEKANEFAADAKGKAENFAGKTLDAAEKILNDVFKKNKTEDAEFEEEKTDPKDVEIDELKNKKRKRGKTGCSLLMHQLVLLPNGDVTVCCADLNSKGVIGNIIQEPLFDIYRKPERLLMLRRFMENRKQDIALCKDCETF